MQTDGFVFGRDREVYRVVFSTGGDRSTVIGTTETERCTHVFSTQTETQSVIGKSSLAFVNEHVASASSDMRKDE